MDPDQFLEKMIPIAQETCDGYNLPWQVCVAQGAIESQWGKYGLGHDGCNLFGRKWGGWGDYVELETYEEEDGELVLITAKFQSYGSLNEAVDDWCVLMTQEPVYMPASEYYFETGDIRGFVDRMAPVYATDSAYASKIWQTMKACDLV